MSSVHRRVALGAAIVGMLAASSGAVNAQTAASAFPKATFAPQDVEIQRLTDGVHMTEEDTAPSRGYGGPTFMAVNPDDPRVIAAAAVNLRDRACRLLFSTDAGATWTFAEELPAPDTYPSCTTGIAGVAQAALAWGSDDTLYYAQTAYGEGEGGREGKTSVVLARTSDLGETWTTTMVADARAQPDPKPENTGVMGLAVDTSGGEDAIYVGFDRDWGATAPEGHELEDRRDVVVGVSTDGGETFGEPVNLNDHSELSIEIAGESYPLHFQTAFGRPFLAAHDGVVLAVGDGGPSAESEPPEDAYDGIFGEADPMMIARSTDQGQTWTVSELSGPIYSGAGSQTGMGWTSEGGEDGTFVLAYSATPGDSPTAGRSDIVVQRSTDNGESWTEPVAINDGDPSEGYTHFYPQLDVAPNGRVDVVWQSNEGLTDFLVDTHYTYSTDGGETWAPNVVASDQPTNFNLGISFNGDIRQPPGVASTDEYAAIGWADTRFADEVTQTQDNFGVIAQFSPLPSEDNNTTLYVVAAILGGLVLAGIILLALQLRRKGAASPGFRT